MLFTQVNSLVQFLTEFHQILICNCFIFSIFVNHKLFNINETLDSQVKKTPGFGGVWRFCAEIFSEELSLFLGFLKIEINGKYSFLIFRLHGAMMIISYSQVY